MATTKSDDIEYREYVVETSDRGVFKIKMPATWKVTYGRVQPAERNQYGDGEFALRIYETKDQQRGIYTHVKSFRDLSIEVSVSQGADHDGNVKWEPARDGQEYVAFDTMDRLRSSSKTDEYGMEESQFPTTPPQPVRRLSQAQGQDSYRPKPRNR